jgi:20S proteasome subunit alpha 3
MPVEYAIEAISHAGAAVGLRTNEGVVLAAEKKILSKVLVSLSRSPLLRVDWFRFLLQLLETSVASEKMCKLDDHVAVAVAGINSDANLLINSARSAHNKSIVDVCI